MSSPSSAQPSIPLQSGEDATARLTFAELEAAVRKTDPTVLVILPRILRRVIKQDCGLAGFGLRVPHRKSYVIGREPLLEIVDTWELGLADDADVPKRVILLPRPSPQRMVDTPSGTLLTHYWRLLFHARVHAALQDRVTSEVLTKAVVRSRIQRLGAAQFDEIRNVLGQEDFLLPPRSDESIYVEFVAVYFELRHFARGLLPHYFPGLEDIEAVDSMLREDVDDAKILSATRLEGADNPNVAGLLHAPEATALGACLPLPDEALEYGETPTSAVNKPVAVTEDDTDYRRLMRKAQRPAALGNVVRAAIYRVRAARSASPQLRERVQSAIRMDVYRLARRLQASLGLDDSAPHAWQEPLSALVAQTARGIWPPAARLLYDLQKACLDFEREVYTIDLVEWAVSRGRRPIRRQLPNQRDVLMLKHLHSAARRLSVVQLSDDDRRQLGALIDSAVKSVEGRLRERLRPRIVAALDDVKLVARNLPERVARKKIIEELLDRACEHGYVTMGDLRDAISRNSLKLPDLAEVRDFFRGDQLLQADRKLSILLDGVYRRGEVYLRWMQRISSLAFGTRAGRFLTRFAVVPFGGAYVALEFLHHVLGWLSGAKAPQPPAHGAATDEHAAEGVSFISVEVLLLGVFLLCLFNSALFRRALMSGLRTSSRVLQAVVIEPIRWFVRSPWLQAIVHSRAFSIAVRFFVKPLVWTAMLWLLLPLDFTNRPASAGAGLTIFLAVNLLLNSRMGRTIEEIAADWIVQGWHRFGVRLIAGVFWFVVDLFKRILEAIERLMYAVDEWLRFRSGESRLSLVAKVALGLVWRPVAYVLRFAVNVLIEPQINPIKHFPVVTVGHKLLLGVYEPFAHFLVTQAGMTKVGAWATATSILQGTPGVFGFLVWELTANWRLYAANRRPDLSPVRIGSHGETMARLLKPGFHSGTLPKRFAKLRRAERRTKADGIRRSVAKHLRALEHIETEIRRYIEREFLELFAQSRCWQARPPELTVVRLATNRVMLAFAGSDHAEAPLQLTVESQCGWIVADVVSAGWAARLLPRQRDVLMTAIIGLYKSAGVDLARQQIESRFPPAMPPYDVSPAGLVLWPDAFEDVEVLYDLHDGEWIAPQSIRGLARRSLPTLDRRQLVFRDASVTWRQWVAAWAREADHDSVAVLPELPVLPA